MEKGLVMKSTGSFYVVKYNNQLITCTIKGKLRTKGSKSTNPVAVGDTVDFEVDERHNTGAITNVCERKNYIIRKSVNLSRESHIIASNIDQAFLLVTVASPTTLKGFMDRFLVSSEMYHIPTILIFNKIDMYTEEQLLEMNAMKAVYEKIGYPCYCVSSIQNIGIDVVQNLMKDKITVIAGNSGVGKSTFINAIDDLLRLKIGAISERHLSGKHTTTFAEMFELQFGGYIIDTPGIRGFGVVDVKKEEITLYFPEMFALLSDCQFYNCTHVHEPNCAIKKAVEEGQISAERYQSYLSIFNGDDGKKYRSKDY